MIRDKEGNSKKLTINEFYVYDTTTKVLRKIGVLSDNPFIGKKLKGEFKGLISLKAWPYRIIYQIVKKEERINIITIEDRQSVYR